MKQIYLLLSIGLFFLSINLQAITAYPGLIEVKQPDGKLLSVYFKGDERLHWATSMDGYTLMRDKDKFYVYAIKNQNGDLEPSSIKANNPDQRSLTEKSFLNGITPKLFFSDSQLQIMQQIWNIREAEFKASKAFPTTGSRKLICILIGFTDKAFTKTQTDFNNLFNLEGYNTGGASGSVKDYYLENSYTQFNLTVDVAGPYLASNNMAYYGANDGDGYDLRPRELVTEAVNLANPSVNFADYDNDGDGSVDGVYVIYAGYGEEADPDNNADAIWAHARNITTVNLDGKNISKYSCSSELRGSSGSVITAIGVICHEFGHVLGAPDYYDTNYSTGGQFEGTGDWDMMAGGSWNNNGVTPAHHNAYTKTVIYGWASATVLSSATTISLSPAETNLTSFYRYNTATSNEYFLMENRQQTGFDLYLPGHGLVIYHVHSSVGTSGINATYPQRMYPVCASATTDPGSTAASYGNINSGGCPFPGISSKSSFTDATLPSSKSWAASNTGKPLTSIVESTGTITLDFMGGAAGNPTNFVATAISGSQIDLTWQLNAGKDVLLVGSTDNIFGTPSNSTTYSIGQTISGGGTVLYKGANTSFNHVDLNALSTYYYKIFSVLTTTPTYSTGTDASATTLCGSVSLPYTQNFDASTMPQCWSQENIGTGITDRWSVSNTSSAGGSAYEMKAVYQSVNPGITRLVSPPINTIGYAYINLSFKHMLDDWAAGATLKVQSSSDGTSWTDESWSLATAGNSNIGPQTINLIINNNINIETTYLCFAITGNLVQFDAWYIDNVNITGAVITNYPEPSNNVSNVSATLNGSTLTLNWTDATGGQVPQAYLIKASTIGFGNIANPADGAVEANGTLVKNVDYGVQTVVFSGVSQSTTYYFKIFPYTNPLSANINYKVNDVSQIEKQVPLLVDLNFGNELVTGMGLPIEPFYGYTYSQSIYLQSEINQANREITRIAYKYSGATAWTDQIVIYMGHTTKTTFSSTTDWIPLASLTQVYSGNIAVTTTPGWVWITLSTPFEYNNTQNLVIAVDENTSGYHNDADEFYCTATPGFNRAIMYRNDATNPDPASPPTAYALRAYYPNITLTMNPKLIFNSSGDNLWNTAANWPGNIIPDANCMVTVPAGQTLIIPASKTNAECKNLTIEPLANLSIDGALNVTGNLLIKSNATGSGSLIDKGSVSISGSKQVQLYLAHNDRYYYVSSPVSGATAGVFGNVATSDLLYYRNTGGSAWERITNSSMELGVGQGFAAKMGTAGRTLIFNGALNTGVKTLTMVNTGDKWNLVGNPYPSPLDWGCENDLVPGWINADIRNVVYVKHGDNFAIWNAAGNGSQINGGSRYIPAMQAFWIKSVGEGVSLAVNNNARVHNSNVLMKVDESLCMKIRVKVTRGLFTDEALLQFVMNAESSVDKYDAEKMFATGINYPQVYFMCENEKLAIASYPPLTEVFNQELGFKTDIAGNFVLNFNDLESFGPNASVFLEDRLSNKMINLLENSVYEFSSEICDNSNRFVMHIADGTSRYNPFDYPGANNIDNLNVKVDIYSSQKSIFVRSDKVLNATIRIYNIFGAEIQSAPIISSFTKIEMPERGCYFVRVMTNSGTKTGKVHIE